MPGHASAPSPDQGLLAIGHSMVLGSAGGINEAQRWTWTVGSLLSPKRICCTYGVGGITSTAILANLATYAPSGQVYLLWLFRNDNSNGLSPATSLANLQAMVARIGHGRFVILSDLWYEDGSEPAGSAARTDLVARNAAAQAAYPGNYLDLTALLDSPSLRVADGLHPNAAGYAIVAAQVAAFVAAKGW